MKRLIVHPHLRGRRSVGSLGLGQEHRCRSVRLWVQQGRPQLHWTGFLDRLGPRR